MGAGGPGSIPGADNLDPGFHPTDVGKMRCSSQCVVRDRYRRRAAVKWLRVAIYAASGSLTVSAGALEIMQGWLFKALQNCSSATFNFFQCISFRLLTILMHCVFLTGL